MKHWPLVFVLLIPCLLACGKGIDLAPADGVVTLDGQPVAEASVMFMPVAGGPVSTAVTDVQGRFEMHTTNAPGALVGKSGVSITKQTFSGLVDGMPGPDGLKIDWLVPEKYARPDTSGLTADVTSAGNSYEFVLSSK